MKSMSKKELEEIKRKFEGKRLVVLVGKPNRGKTTTLFEVARQLAKDWQPECQQCCVDAAFNTFINPDETRSDIRIVLPTDNGEYVYLSSHGDDLRNIENNLKFFTNSLDHSLHLYLAHEKGLRRIDWKNGLIKYPPTVCVTACSYPQEGKMKEEAEKMKEELEFVDDKRVWQPKEPGIKQLDGSYDNSQMIEKMMKIIKEQVEHQKIEVL